MDKEGIVAHAGRARVIPLQGGVVKKLRLWSSERSLLLGCELLKWSVSEEHWVVLDHVLKSIAIEMQSEISVWLAVGVLEWGRYNGRKGEKEDEEEEESG